MGRQGKGKVPPTLNETIKEVPQEEDNIISAPVEIIFHIAGTRVQKLQTPTGIATILSLISPTGLAVTVNMNDENVNELIKSLQGEKSLVDIYSALPPGLAS